MPEDWFHDADVAHKEAGLGVPTAMAGAATQDRKKKEKRARATHPSIV